MAGIAIVGASQSGIPWTEWLLRSLAQYGYTGPTWLINPRYETLLGQRCFPTVESLPEDPQLGVMMVGARLVAPLCAELLGRGCKRFIIVSNGFAETGTDAGRSCETALQAVFDGSDALVVGPNCVGFAAFHEPLCAITQPVPHGIVPGSVSVVSQSGGLTAAAMGAVFSEGLGLDVCYSIGNGAVFGLGAAIRSALERETTRTVVGVIESVDDPAAIEAAARYAERAGKTIAFLHLGQSEAGRGIAQSHTGAIVGEQRLVSAWLQSLGIVLADSAEQLGRIAALVTKVGRPRPGTGTFIATVSGGGAGLSSDLASRSGVRFAQVQSTTLETLRALLPAGAYIGNPLDVQTGDGNAVYTAIAEDPNVGLMIEPWMLPWPDEELHWQRAALERIAGIAERAGVPLLVGSLFNQPLNDWAAGFGTRTGVSVTPNLEQTLAALGKLYAAASVAPPPPPGPAPAQGPIEHSPRASRAGGALITEVQARVVLADAGLPVVGGVVAREIDELAARADGLRRPWVAKVDLPEVGHKGRIGGVRLGLTDAAALRVACEEMAQAAVDAGAARVPSEVGFLVTETEFGPELLVGALRDPVAGPSLTVAVGGWAAESGNVFGTVPVPIDAETLRDLVRSWKLDHLLGERRAGELAGFLHQLGTQFAGGALSGYDTVEINPLMLTDHGPSIVDALLVERAGS